MLAIKPDYLLLNGPLVGFDQPSAAALTFESDR
jgi:hypothetical protein